MSRMKLTIVECCPLFREVDHGPLVVVPAYVEAVGPGSLLLRVKPTAADAALGRSIAERTRAGAGWLPARTALAYQPWLIAPCARRADAPEVAGLGTSLDGCRARPQRTAARARMRAT